MNELDFYSRVSNHKVLSREEELKLTTATKNGDTLAREKLIMSNIRLAKKIAKSFHNNSNSSLEDLVQEAILGLCKSVDLFEPNLGHKFSTYASWWIKQRVRSYILSMSSIAKLPGNGRQLSWQVNNLIKEYKESFGTTPSIEELSNALNVTPSLLQGVVSCIQQPINLDSPVKSSDEGVRFFHETIEDENAVDASENIDNQKLISAIIKGISKLTPREETILRLRFGIIDDLRSKKEYSEENLILCETKEGV
jgi:RNA polymerase primary sigma factor